MSNAFAITHAPPLEVAAPREAAPPPPPAAIDVRDVRKSYGDRDVLRGVSLRIEPGEVFAILGPNGAGKTTLLESLVGIRTFDAGSATVLGLDPRADRKALRDRIGVQPQEASLFPTLTTIESLVLFASFHDSPRDPETLLRELGLEDSRDQRVKRLSGGQRQRLLLGLAFIGRPRLMVLDEPSAGLDPHARRQIWEVVRAHRADGGTVLLTTHSMEEAAALADRLALLDDGRIVAQGTPDELVRDHAGGHRAVRFRTDAEPSADRLEDLGGVTTRTNDGWDVRVPCDDADDALSRVMRADDLGGVRDVRIDQPTLEDVFLSLTGRSLESPDNDTEGAAA
jgi:ABC-2 type transport system ATP-binding protein